MHYKYYYRARYYDPALGRFLSEDPIGFKSQDTNFYRYVFNNPLKHTDPSGKAIPLIGIAVIGIIALLPGELDDDVVTGERSELSKFYDRWQLDEVLRRLQKDWQDLNLFDDKNDNPRKPRKDDPGQCYKA